MLGGHAAEGIVFGDTTTGASNDIEKATGLARRMVTEFGMSERLGPRAFGKRDEMVFLGREIGEQRNYSDDVAKEIDEEVRAIIETAYARASEVLTEHRGQARPACRDAGREGDARRGGVRGALRRPAAQGAAPRRRPEAGRGAGRRPPAAGPPPNLPRSRPDRGARHAQLEGAGRGPPLGASGDG